MKLESHLPLVLDLFLKSSAILLAAFAIAWLARAASAARLHLVWLAAFIALAVLPLTSAIPPRWSWSWQRPAPALPVIRTTAALAIHELPSAAVEAAPVESVWKFPGWPVVAGGAWLAGVVLLLGRQGAGFWKLRGLRRHSSPIASGPVTEMTEEFGTVELRESSRCTVPLTWGWPRPVVMLPAAATAWPQAQLRAALAHEFGHIARRDFLSRQLAQIVRAFLWPSPLVWLAVRALHRTQEQACDDLVLRRGAAPREYAMQLLEATRALAAPTFTCSQAVAMAQPSTLEGRVRAIVDDRRDRSAADLRSRIAAATAIAAVIAGSAFAQVKSEPQQNPARRQITFEVKVMEAPDGAMGISLEGDKASRQRKLDENEFQMELQKLDLKGFIPLSAPKVTTRSGQRATVEIGHSNSQPASPALKFDVLPTIAADGRLRLDFSCATEFVESGKMDARRLETSASIASGQTLLVGGETGEKGRMILLTVTASIVEAEGQTPTKPELPEKPQPGEKVPGKPGFVTSPYAPAAGYIDVRGFAPGKEIKDPYTGKILLVPSDTPAVDFAAERIILPKFELKDAGIEEAVKVLNRLGKENDRIGKGVTITLQKISPKVAEARITLSLFNIPLLLAVKYVTDLADCRLKTTDEAILIAPPGEPTEPPPAAPGTNISAANANFDNKTKTAVFDGNVTFNDGTAKITGNQLRLDKAKRKVEVTAPAATGVRGKDTPIEINAEATRYEGDVAFAEGNVNFWDGFARVLGDKLRYEQKTRRVEATGSVRIEVGGNVTTAEKVIYWLDTGKFQTEGPTKTMVKEPKTPAR